MTAKKAFCVGMSGRTRTGNVQTGKWRCRDAKLDFFNA